MILSKIIKNLLDKSKVKTIYDHLMIPKSDRKKAQFLKEDFVKFKLSESNSFKRFDSDFDSYPLLDDKTNTTYIEPHYTYHPAWAARVLAQTKPIKHIDISSILHFSTIVSAFIPIDFYDYRPANVFLTGLCTASADLTNLHFEDNSLLSLSCMHTIEHIGLGRYGDEIDYDGDIKAAGELIRVLAIDGDLLIVTPIGKPKIAFNAHRIYSYEQIIKHFDKLKLMEFSLIPDEYENIGIIKDADEETCNQQNWGCGCFWFRKIT